MSEIEKEKENQNELPILRRMTKRQVQEVYDLLEEGKTLEEISEFFQKRYKCKPLSRNRLQKHAVKFYKLKREKVMDRHNKIHHPQPLVFIITNQNIRTSKEDLFQTLKLFKNLEETPKTEKIYCEGRNGRT